MGGAIHTVDDGTDDLVDLAILGGAGAGEALRCGRKERLCLESRALERRSAQRPGDAAVGRIAISIELNGIELVVVRTSSASCVVCGGVVAERRGVWFDERASSWQGGVGFGSRRAGEKTAKPVALANRRQHNKSVLPGSHGKHPSLHSESDTRSLPLAVHRKP